MCWVCERLENLIASWNEEREFQEQTSSEDYHRGLSKGFSECVIQRFSRRFKRHIHIRFCGCGPHLNLSSNPAPFSHERD